MPNRFTRIPDGPPPPLPRAVGVVVPVADLMMLLMVSRPATGSLRTTWVTPATLWLAAATVAAALLLLAVATPALRGAGAWIAGVCGVLLLIGSGAILTVAVAQRRGL